MASNITSLLFLSSILLVSALTNAVSDSDITRVCSKTKEPNVCKTSLKSDPTWATTDMHGLGEISLKQAVGKAKYMPQYLGSISARAEPQLASKYEACSKDYETVISKLNAAVASYSSGNVAAASQAAKAAFGLVGVSLNRFNQPPTDPSEFTDFCLEIQTLCQAFTNIASSLGH